MAELIITKENFEEKVLKADKTVLLDFWAPWCGPCRMFASVVSEIAESHKDTLTVGKVNVDEQMELAQQFGIESIPTVLIFKNGKLANQSVGFQPASAVEELLK